MFFESDSKIDVTNVWVSGSERLEGFESVLATPRDNNIWEDVVATAFKEAWSLPKFERGAIFRLCYRNSPRMMKTEISPKQFKAKMISQPQEVRGELRERRECYVKEFNTRHWKSPSQPKRLYFILGKSYRWGYICNYKRKGQQFERRCDFRPYARPLNAFHSADTDDD